MKKLLDSICGSLNTSHTSSIANEECTELWSNTLDIRPPLEGGVIDDLLRMAGSRATAERRFVARHKLTPIAQIIMMQDDEDEVVRAIVKIRMAWAEKNSKGEQEHTK